jgi:uncharacterized protein
VTIGQSVTFDVDGRTVHGTLTAPQVDGPPATGTPGLIFVHGLGGSQQGYVRRAGVLAGEVPVISLSFDLSGHGDSAADLEALTPRDHLDELVAAYDLLVEQSGVNADRIGVCGVSYGAYLAVLLSSLRPVTSLLLRAPALYGDHELDESLRRGRSTSSEAPANLFLTTLHEYCGQVSVVASGEDEVVSPETLDRYLAHIRYNTLVTIPGAGHVLDTPEHRAVFLKAIVDWARDL